MTTPLSCRSQLFLTHLYHKEFSIPTISLLLLSTPRINSSPAPFAKAIMYFNHFALCGRELFNILLQWNFSNKLWRNGLNPYHSTANAFLKNLSKTSVFVLPSCSGLRLNLFTWKRNWIPKVIGSRFRVHGSKVIAYFTRVQGSRFSPPKHSGGFEPMNLERWTFFIVALSFY